MSPDERDQFLKVVVAHERTIDVCQACAETTRDLAAEVKRGGQPPADHLAATITEAENVLQDLRRVRAEIERLKRLVGSAATVERR
jgi:uncharacterized protein Yka (UPF0111/DUF47 family)